MKRKTPQCPVLWRSLAFCGSKPRLVSSQQTALAWFTFRISILIYGSKLNKTLDAILDYRDSCTRTWIPIHASMCTCTRSDTDKKMPARAHTHRIRNTNPTITEESKEARRRTLKYAKIRTADFLKHTEMRTCEIVCIHKILPYHRRNKAIHRRQLFACAIWKEQYANLAHNNRWLTRKKVVW